MSYPIPERLHGVRVEDFARAVVTMNCGRSFSMRRTAVWLDGKRALVTLRARRYGDPVPHMCHTCDRIRPLFGSDQ